MTGAVAAPADVLTFWRTAGPDKWFAKDDAFDAAIRDKFLATYEAAAAGRLGPWEQTADGALALVITLDQFPRNMFRGMPQAFTTDALAREAANSLIQAGFDQKLLPVERSFIYMPFMHSETLTDQHDSVLLFQQLAQERDYLNSVTYAVRHRHIIERFGRFPHRNPILGRPSTPEETEFLTQPGPSF